MFRVALQKRKTYKTILCDITLTEQLARTFKFRGQSLCKTYVNE